MTSTELDKDRLLSLSEAAERLGVHPATVRRWADRGEIEVRMTAGGHRRFPLSAVRRLMEGGTPAGAGSEATPVDSPADRGTSVSARPDSGAEPPESLASRAIQATRGEIRHHYDERWIAGMSEKEREEKRMLGRRLVGLMMQYISAGDGEGEDALAEARAIGRLYARTSLQAGIDLADALQATMFFRDNLAESAVLEPTSAGGGPEASKRVRHRINEFLNAVQLAVAGVYDDARGSGS